MSKKRPLWVADSETDPFLHGRFPAPFIWGVYNGTVYQQFDSTRDFVDYISEIDCVVYAHNGGKFDWHFFLSQVPEFTELMVINGRVSKFNIGLCEFRDSYNILPARLAKIGAKDIDFDYSILEKEVRDHPQNRRETERYLVQDCIALYDAVAGFEAEYGRPLTLAGAAFRHWHQMSGLPVPQSTKLASDTARPFYYGGRVEVGHWGEYWGDFEVVDLNSAYPRAMCDHHPYGEVLEIIDHLPDTRAEIEMAMITLTCVSRGALPYKAPDGPEKGELKFPDDDARREYHVTGWEYLAGIDTSTISDIDIIECIIYDDVITFSQYVDHYTQQKIAAKEARDDMAYARAKLFLNTLYGKYAADPEKYQDHMILGSRNTLAAEEDGWSFCGEVARDLAVVSRPIAESKHRYYNVATAASITGYVRAQLWLAICKVGRTNVLYCDTDSLATTNTTGLDLHPTRLGAWDVEASCDYAAIAAKKLYAFRRAGCQGQSNEYKTAHRGVRLTPRQIITVARGGSVIYKSDAPTFSITNGWSFTERTITGCAETKTTTEKEKM